MPLKATRILQNYDEDKIFTLKLCETCCNLMLTNVIMSVENIKGERIMKKKIIFLLIIILALIGAFSVVNAASISAPGAVNVGDRITVTVNFGGSMRSSNFTLSWNAGVFNLVGSPSGFTGGGGSGTLLRTPFTDPTSAASFTFEAIGSGTGNFTASGLDFMTVDGQPIQAGSRSTSTTASVPAPPPAPPTAPDSPAPQPPAQGGLQAQSSTSGQGTQQQQRTETTTRPEERPEEQQEEEVPVDTVDTADIVNKEVLEELILIAEERAVRLQSLLSLLEEAKRLFENEYATDAERAVLEELIRVIGKETEGLEALLEILAEAIRLFADEYATQEEIDNIRTSLQEALERVEYEKEIEYAEEESNDTFTYVLLFVLGTFAGTLGAVIVSVARRRA